MQKVVSILGDSDSNVRQSALETLAALAEYSEFLGSPARFMIRLSARRCPHGNFHQTDNTEGRIDAGESTFAYAAFCTNDYHHSSQVR
jgi:hypothetical protein